jgi:hypothetical protein
MRGSAAAFPALRLVRASPETYRSDQLRSLLEANFFVCYAPNRTLFISDFQFITACYFYVLLVLISSPCPTAQHSCPQHHKLRFRY